jgi:hypothetical protein
MGRPLPPGFVEVEPGLCLGPLRRVGPDAFLGLVEVALGAPGEDHDCDAMGCGSAGEHVVSRVERFWPGSTSALIGEAPRGFNAPRSGEWYETTIRRLTGVPHPRTRRPDPREYPRNCWTCRHARYVGGYGAGFTCDALSGDEDRDAPIIDYVDTHCATDGMPTGTAPCSAWGRR